MFFALLKIIRNPIWGYFGWVLFPQGRFNFESFPHIFFNQFSTNTEFPYFQVTENQQYKANNTK